MHVIKSAFGVVMLAIGGLIVLWQARYLHMMFSGPTNDFAGGLALIISAPFCLLAVVLIGFGLGLIGRKR